MNIFSKTPTGNTLENCGGESLRISGVFFKGFWFSQPFKYIMQYYYNIIIYSFLKEYSWNENILTDDGDPNGSL